MNSNVKVQVSKYLSYLLRHNPKDLEMDDEGFVEFEKLISKIRQRYPMVDKNLLKQMVDQSERKRFEIVNGKIRAMYGHTIPVHLALKEDHDVILLYHGTTPEATKEILEKGLQPMRRRWVHLSPTEGIAQEVGKRRAITPVVLVVDAARARDEGVQFFKVTDKVYLSKFVPAKYITRLGV